MCEYNETFVVDNENEIFDDLLVEITGLEILTRARETNYDDFSFDSFAVDSLQLVSKPARQPLGKGSVHKQLRRSSMGSCANAPTEFGRYRNTSMRRCSMGSFANDSVDCGFGRRRASMDSAVNDSIDNPRFLRNRSLRPQRRSSIGSVSMESILHPSTHHRDMSSFSEFANDSLDIALASGPMKPASAQSKTIDATHTTFSREIYETQLINGGAGRAA